jgi:hypothetical protein
MAINRIKTGGITDGTIQSGDLAPGTIASDRIAPGTIANDRLANTSITINGTSIALGASGEIVAGTDWQAVTVADGSTTVNASAGQGYFLDTNAGVIEVFLPTSPTRGDTIILMDYAGTFATNNVYVNTGTVNLDSTTTYQYKLSTNDTIAEFVYVDSAKGWVTRINTTTGTTPSGVYNETGTYDGIILISATGGTVTESGDYKIHTFTGDGCFTISSINPSSPSSVDYLVVAGGGASGQDQAGAGGAGGYRESYNPCTSGTYSASPLATPTSLPVSVQSYPVTVGAGGAGAPYPSPVVNGSDSVFSTITSTGGGGGGTVQGPANGSTGGSGGGGSERNSGSPNAGSAGNTPPTSPPQGNSGGAGLNANYNGGGGGAGEAGNTDGGGYGGDGVASSITGSPVFRAGGGGSGSNPNLPTGLPGGDGGGGHGTSPLNPLNSSTTNGAANTGGGGGSATGYGGIGQGGNSGGKGIVIIRYKYL